MSNHVPRAQYFVDEQGKPTSVLLSLRAYQRLLRRLEDLEDALALDKARAEASNFTDYSVVREQLKRAGRL